MQRISKGAIAIILLLIIALLGVGAVGYLTKGFQNWSYKEWFSKDIKDPIIDSGKDSNKSSALVTDGDGKELVSGVVYDLPSSIVFNGVTGKKTNTALYSDDDVSTVADEDGGILLQAIIKPDYAIDKSVDWTINWVDSNNSWANGKDISDYLSIIPNSDGSTIAKLYCIERFGAQVQITVTSRRNPNVTRSCKVDMRKREDGNLNFYDSKISNNIDALTTSINLYDIDPSVTLDFNKLYFLDYDAFFALGTVGNGSFGVSDFYFTLINSSPSGIGLLSEIIISDNIYNYLLTKFVPISDRTLNKTLSMKYTYEHYFNGTKFNGTLSLIDETGKNSITIDMLNRLQDVFFETRSVDNLVKIVEALKLYNGESLLFSFRCTHERYADIYNQTVSIKFDPSTITLDPTDIEFPDIVLP